jgi:hypothetical protein
MCRRPIARKKSVSFTRSEQGKGRMDSRCPFSPLHLHSHPKERVICRRKHANEGFLGSGTVAATRLHSHHPIGYSVFGRALSTPFVESRSNRDPPWVDIGGGHCVDFDLLEGGDSEFGEPNTEWYTHLSVPSAVSHKDSPISWFGCTIWPCYCRHHGILVLCPTPKSTQTISILLYRTGVLP